MKCYKQGSAVWSVINKGVLCEMCYKQDCCVKCYKQGSAVWSDIL